MKHYIKENILSGLKRLDTEEIEEKLNASMCYKTFSFGKEPPAEYLMNSILIASLISHCEIKVCQNGEDK